MPLLSFCPSVYAADILLIYGFSIAVFWKQISEETAPTNVLIQYYISIF